MKKIIIGVVSLIIILILCEGAYILLNRGNSECKVIAENSYQNWAWGHQYSGSLICDDGSIYEFNAPQLTLDGENLENDSKLLLRNATKKVKWVEKSDIEKIKELSSQITEQYESESKGADQGSSGIIIWNYNSNNKITLKTVGDWNVTNTSDASKELTNIIQKYLK